MLIYFNTSPKRENLLIHIIEQKRFSEEKKKVLIGVCQTRWSERYVSYERFNLALPFIVEAFEVINGYQNVNTCIGDIQLLRENVDQESDVIFKQAVRMVDQLNVEPNIPRAIFSNSSRQCTS